MNDSFFGRLKDLIINPGRLMENVGANPSWWQPGLLVCIVMIGFSWMTLPISAPEQAELMRDSKLMQMVPEEAADQQYEEARNITPSQRIIQSGIAGFTTWLLVLIFGLILGFFVRLSGGEGSFKQALTIVSWGSIPMFVIGSLVKLPLILQTESVFKVNIGLAALLPGGDPGSVLFQTLMAYGDFFAWWGLFLLVIGFERVFSIGRSVAVLSVLLPWALLSAIGLGISLLVM
ncbi:MAG: YIP1 family protein [Candidatus Krumholzibacteria bacterium]|nr:YIP1 family protein [Candidatus Krumholzibacteria bacterium]